MKKGGYLLKLTKVQITTIISAIAFLFWELYIKNWSKTQIGAIIRVDLLFIIPFMLVMVIISIIQLIKTKKN